MVLALLFVFLCLPVLPKGAVWPARALLLLFAAALGGWVWQKLRRIAHNPKPAIFATIALVLTAGIAYGLVEAVSWVVLQRNPVAGNPFVLTGPQKRFVDLVVNDRPNYQVYSPTLAWTIAPEQESSDKLYRSNAGGFRANREYSREVPPGKTRVLCFGDSFTHCDECGNEDTWPHQAEVAAPDMEFLNFGVPGYSLVQAYIRYTEVARRFETRHVIIGCMTEDLKRSVNVYYPLRYSNPADSPNAAALPYAALDEAGKLDIKLPMLRSREDYASLLKEPRPWIKKMIKRDVLYRHVDSTPFVTLLADRWEGLHGRLDPPSTTSSWPSTASAAPARAASKTCTPAWPRATASASATSSRSARRSSCASTAMLKETTRSPSSSGSPARSTSRSTTKASRATTKSTSTTSKEKASATWTPWTGSWSPPDPTASSRSTLCSRAPTSPLPPTPSSANVSPRT